MASKRNVKIETPGDPIPDETAASPATNAPSNEDASAAMEAPTPAEETAAASTKSGMTEEQELSLRDQLALTSKLVGSSKALDWSDRDNGLKKAEARVDPDAHLPAADSVDPDAIKEPVLTKGGWVLPTKDPRARFAGR